MISVHKQGYNTQSFTWFPPFRMDSPITPISSVILVVSDEKSDKNINDIVMTGKELIRSLENYNLSKGKDCRKISVFYLINTIKNKKKRLSLNEIYDLIKRAKIDKLCSLSSTLFADIINTTKRLKKLDQCSEWLGGLFRHDLKMRKENGAELN